MRVGISCYPTYGGSGVVASEVALALAEAGDEVHVVSYACPPRLVGELERVHFHRVEVRTYPLFEYPPYSLALATKLVEVARLHQLDVLHVHYAVPNAVSAILARQMLAPQPLPVVTTLHGTDVTLVGNDPSYLETTRFGVMQSDAVTAVSEWLRRTTLEQLEIAREIEVIPNFLDPRRYRHLPEPLSADGERVLVHVSNFRRVKRPLDVVEVFRRIADELPSRLLLVGEGPELAAVEERATELGVRDLVELLGNVDEIEHTLARAHLFLLTSAQESFGLAALEALGAGVPVVATDVGGVPDVVREGEWGRLFGVGDIEAMARGAVELLRDETLRRRMAAAGKRFALEAFSRESAVASYRRVYRRIAQPSTHPAPV